MRSTAPKAKLGRPAPRINGATIMWSRSRHPAWTKRERVFVPPSTSTRRSPSLANAIRISAGEICPSGVGKVMVSTPRTGKAEVSALTTIVRLSWLHNRALCGSRPRGSTTTRTGLGPLTRRTVSCGSSLHAVSTPTTTASTRARRR